jgi:hypothetical protein
MKRIWRPANSSDYRNLMPYLYRKNLHLDPSLKAIQGQRGTEPFTNSIKQMEATIKKVERAEDSVLKSVAKGMGIKDKVDTKEIVELMEAIPRLMNYLPSFIYSALMNDLKNNETKILVGAVGERTLNKDRVREILETTLEGFLENQKNTSRAIGLINDRKQNNTKKDSSLEERFKNEVKTYSTQVFNSVFQPLEGRKYKNQPNMTAVAGNIGEAAIGGMLSGLFKELLSDKATKLIYTGIGDAIQVGQDKFHSVQDFELEFKPSTGAKIRRLPISIKTKPKNKDERYTLHSGKNLSGMLESSDLSVVQRQAIRQAVINQIFWGDATYKREVVSKLWRKSKGKASEDMPAYINNTNTSSRAVLNLRYESAIPFLRPAITILYSYYFGKTLLGFVDEVKKGSLFTMVAGGGENNMGTLVRSSDAMKAVKDQLKNQVGKRTEKIFEVSVHNLAPPGDMVNRAVKGLKIIGGRTVVRTPYFRDKWASNTKKRLDGMFDNIKITTKLNYGRINKA